MRNWFLDHRDVTNIYKGCGKQKIPQKAVQLHPKLAQQTISEIRNFFNHPEKGGQIYIFWNN